MNRTLYILLGIAFFSCGRKENNSLKNKSQDTAMLGFPVLMLRNQDQFTLTMHDPKIQKGGVSHGQDYLTMKIDEEAKEIIIEPSRKRIKEFYDDITLSYHGYLPKRYIDSCFQFYWMDTNHVQRRLRYIVEESFKPVEWLIQETKGNPKHEKVLTRDEFDSFMKNLQYEPKEYYSRFLIKNANPKFQYYHKGLDERMLNMEDYYAIFQKGYPYTYVNCHPYYFLAYKKHKNFTQFFIYHYIEAAGYSMYLIHLNDTGKKVFETIIWTSGGDGGDYVNSSNSYVSENSAACTNESGYWNDNPNKPEWRQVTKTKYHFDEFGWLKIKEETEINEGIDPHENYDPWEWFPEE